MRNNKLPSTKSSWTSPELPTALRGVEGIGPTRATLTQTFGPEVILFWIDRHPFIKQLADLTPFNLQLKAGLVRTSFGPLLFLLFFVPNSAHPNEPYVAVDCHVDPLQAAHMQLWKGLATQSHWHVVYLDEELELLDLKEFPNIFGLAETLEWVQEACEGMTPGSFDLAKEEFCAKYDISDLLAMKAAA